MSKARPNPRHRPYDHTNRHGSTARRPHTHHSVINNIHGGYSSYNTTNQGNNNETSNASQLLLQVDTPHGHSLSLTHRPQFSPFPCEPSLPSSLRYSLLLFQERQGYPLWSPRPATGLPKQYIDEGIRIGDVGIIYHDRPFDFLFNMTCSENDPIHHRGVPPGFVPIPMEELEIDDEPGYRSKNSHIFAPTGTLRGEKMAKADLDAKYQTAFEFTSLNNSDHGAILALPEGSNRCCLRNQGIFHDYALQHAKNWFQYAEERRHRKFPPNRDPSLYLVTGCEKCSAWGITSFFNPEPRKLVTIPFNATKVNKAQTGGSNAYSWGYDSRCTTKCHPNADDKDWKGSPLQNQCVFLRGYKVTKRREDKVKVQDITEEGAKVEKILDIQQSEHITNHSANLSSGAHLPSQGWASGSGSSSNSQIWGSTYSGSLRPSGSFLEIDDRMTWERPSLYHPCDVINNLMFDVCAAYHADSEVLAGRVQIAISHDDDWCSLDSPVSDGSNFIKSLVHRCNIVVDKDTVYTELVQAKSGADERDQGTESLPMDGTARLKVRVMGPTQSQPSLDSHSNTMEIEKTTHEVATVRAPQAQPLRECLDSTEHLPDQLCSEFTSLEIRPTNSCPSNPSEENHPDVVGNLDDFSQAGFSSGRLTQFPPLVHQHIRTKRWNRRFHADADEQTLENFLPPLASPLPFSGHQLYHHAPSYLYPMDGTGPTNPYPPNRVYPDVVGNVGDFSRAGFSNGQLVPASNSGHDQSVFASPRYATSYDYMSSSDPYEYMNAVAGPSLPDTGHQSFRATAHSWEPSFAVNAAGSSHIRSGGGSEISDHTYPLSATNDAQSAKSVPDPNGQSRVFKEVVATGGVFDASMRRRHLTPPSRLYRCTGFPPCQATFTTSHNLKNHIDSHLGNKQHQCSYCPARTVTLSDIKRHQKTCKYRPSTTPGPS